MLTGKVLNDVHRCKKNNIVMVVACVCVCDAIIVFYRHEMCGVPRREERPPHYIVLRRHRVDQQVATMMITKKKALEEKKIK